MLLFQGKVSQIGTTCCEMCELSFALWKTGTFFFHVEVLILIIVSVCVCLDVCVKVRSQSAEGQWEDLTTSRWMTANQRTR